MMSELAINNEKFRYLQLVEFKNLGFWDANTYTKIKNRKIGYEPLGLVLSQRKGSITIDDDLVYKRCRVQIQGRGIVLRDKVFGKEIKTKKQQVCKTDDFLVAEIDAKVGGFGIVFSDLEGAVVSSHYFLFEINKLKLLPEFLGLVIKFEPFLEQVKATGSTNYAAIRPHHVLEYQIPLPPLSKQREFIATYNQKLLDSEAKEQKANQLEKSIDEYLIEELGIELPKTALQQSGFLKLTDFKNLSRWDVWALGKSGSSKKYDNLPFKDVVIGKPMYGANTKTLKQKTDVRYIRITDINEDGSLEQEIVSPLKFEEKYLLQENDFLIARSGNTVGKTFLYKKNFGRCCFAGYLVKYKIDESKILPEFLLYYTKSKIFKNWINSNQRVAGQPNINGQEYLIFPVVLPPFEIQNKIAAKITSIKEEIKTLRQEAQNLKAQAKEEFEKEVFG